MSTLWYGMVFKATNNFFSFKQTCLYYGMVSYYGAAFFYVDENAARSTGPLRHPAAGAYLPEVHQFLFYRICYSKAQKGGRKGLAKTVDPENKPQINKTVGDSSQVPKHDRSAPVAPSSGEERAAARSRCDAPNQPINHQDGEQMLGEENLVYRDGDREVYMFPYSDDIARRIRDRANEKPAEFSKVKFWNQTATGVESSKQDAFMEEIVHLLQSIDERLWRLESFLMRTES